MSCDARQEQVGLLIDAELPESEQVTVFRHLQECPECRLFFESMARFRKAAKKDREEIFLEAEEVLPAKTPRPEARRAAWGHRWFPFAAGGWRLPAPVAVAAATMLLVVGILLGSRLPAPGGSDRDRLAELTAEPSVIVVCSLPEVEVLGAAVPQPGGPR